MFTLRDTVSRLPRNNKNMPKSNIKYEIANQEPDVPDYFLQHDTQFKNTPTKHLSFWWGILLTSLLILLYFVLSVGLSFYQQWLLKSWDFHYPLGVVLCHLFVKFLLSALVRCVLECKTGQQRVILSWQNMLIYVAPPGIASGHDIGFSNWALELLTMSVYTMTKSTTIIFILGFALLFKLERKSWSLVGTVMMISGGLAMFTYKSAKLDSLGLVFALLASFSSGLRWTMAQLVMQKSKLGLGNPIDMMYHMQPWMFISIIPVALWFEGTTIKNGLANTNWTNTGSVLVTIAAVLGGAIIAFCMELAEYMVVTRTSSLTLSISGIFKEICTLILAFEWKGDEMSSLNFVGLLLCLGGIILHSFQKFRMTRKDKIEDLELEHNSMLNNRTKSDDGFDTNLPLLSTQKSTSLTNLLNEFFSSDEDENKNEESSSQVLFNILHRREQ
ncbi:solute carrier family 35 member C2 [Neodiprion virginianus]|uniref:solute carrier family 35 member C2 n=1 Tax=Neodiprion virginianus TaxID=2961670 RepID=UPI001EE77381|nr:solute carrier family 35 member C2 [Neodiprion virginianus]